MSQEYFDPRAPLDYSDFLEVGEMEVVRHVPKGIDADPIGMFPRQSPMSGEERAQFEAVRARLDRVLQATKIRPLTPQENISPAAYEASLLKEIAKHTSGRIQPQANSVTHWIGWPIKKNPAPTSKGRLVKG